jgi:phospholipase C
MFENRSFDQMLGCVPGVDGADIANANPDSTGHPFHQTPADPSAVDPGPMHETEHVLRQIADRHLG